MTPQEFVAKWGRADLPERGASQEHFLDLCRLLGQPTPASHDATGAEYAFEKGVEVSAAASKGSKGSWGFADVWWRGKFAWEYKRKGKYKSLDEAYKQLCQYREALDNPPVLIVSDIARTEIHTNFTGTKKEVHVIALEDLAKPESLDLLRRVFTDPASLRPTEKVEDVTEQAAKEIGHIAQSLRDRGHDPHETAHFLMKCMFCLFAEDTDLLPKDLFKRLLEGSKYDPPKLKGRMDALFDAMRTGGDFGIEQIAYFNGGLFDESDALELTEEEIAALIRASNKGWESVEPSIFGTLFERSLDPGKRAQIGAHYTSREDIMLVVEPVILRPLRREWDEVRGRCEGWVAERAEAARAGASRKKGSRTPEWYTKQIEGALLGFDERLAGVRVLDPACGSGNFLYVAIQQLLGLEKEVITYAADVGLGLIPHVRPTQLRGIEINPYAAELAQVVIWIGYLQWMRDNGFRAPANPILEPMRSIENRDAILAWEDEAGESIPVWREGARCRGKAGWPEAEFIVGNPPFLGTKLLRRGLGDEYAEAMFDTYGDDIPNFSDLCCYWFELARIALDRSSELRAGLLATQGIRGKDNRVVLDRIRSLSRIFEAHADRKWLLDGAAVHVSIVCFGGTADGEDARLDEQVVAEINADLTTGAAVGTAVRLLENADIGFVADVKSGRFDIDASQAREWLATPTPNGRSPADVVRPWWNGLDLTRRPRSIWIVDFGSAMSEAEASAFGDPFEHVRREVKPARDQVKRKRYREYWWLHAEPCQAMRDAIGSKPRFLATAVLTKHRLFGWGDSAILPDHQLIAFARSDDYFFGVLHSSVHELWARRQGTQLREAESGFRYTPTTCFETFPLPWAPGSEPGVEGMRRGEGGEEGALPRPLPPGAGGEQGQHALWAAISEAARELDAQRERWLNPPEWVAAIAAGVDAADDFADVSAVSGEEARRLIRQSAIDAAAARDPRLKKRTLTNLYNERPTWLKLAHERLDRAVLAAYAAVDPPSGDWAGWDVEWARVWVETGAGQALPAGHAMEAERGEIEERVLSALLRLNGERAGLGGG